MKAQVDSILKLAFQRPYYLSDNEWMDVRSWVKDTEDTLYILGSVHDKATTYVIREAEVSIEGKDWNRLQHARSKGAIVDAVVAKLDELVEKLEPEELPDDLMSLVLEAHWGEKPTQALDVLCDALLERGDIKPPLRKIGRRSDTRTDEEKRQAERDDLRNKALRWARPYVEILFRRNWSTKPWATYSARFADFDGSNSFFGINREVDPTRLAGMRVTPITLAGLRDRVRQLSDLRDAEILDDE